MIAADSSCTQAGPACGPPARHSFSSSNRQEKSNEAPIVERAFLLHYARSTLLVFIANWLQTKGRGAGCGGWHAGHTGPDRNCDNCTCRTKQRIRGNDQVATVSHDTAASQRPHHAILVRSGDRVSAGQVMMEIDSQPQVAHGARRNAPPRIRRKRVYDYNVVERDRQRKLFEAGVTSRDAWDQAQQSYANAKADYESAVSLTQNAGSATCLLHHSRAL